MTDTATGVIDESVMGRKRSSATNLGATLVTALAERDFDRLTDAFAPDVRMRALSPPGLVEVLGGEAAAAKFASWFGGSDRLELAHFDIELGQCGQDLLGGRGRFGGLWIIRIASIKLCPRRWVGERPFVHVAEQRFVDVLSGGQHGV